VRAFTTETQRTQREEVLSVFSVVNSGRKVAMVKAYDITVPIRAGMPVWPGDAAVSVERIRSMEGGSRASVSRICMGSHTGTHVDPPAHFIPGGATVDNLPLDVLIGEAWVAEFDTSGPVRAEDLDNAGIPTGTERLLLKTRNSALWRTCPDKFCAEFAHLTEDAARRVVERGVRLVGIDYLSVQGFHDSGGTHTVLLGAGVVVLEGLNLADVPPGWYQLICLPLKVQGGDGAPARVVLLEE